VLDSGKIVEQVVAPVEIDQSAEIGCGQHGEDQDSGAEFHLTDPLAVLDGIASQAAPLTSLS
jgi:hypothetical protein